LAHTLGDRSRRLTDAAALLTPKGRRAAERFLFEGETLLREARDAELPAHEIFATQRAYDRTPLLREMEQDGTPLWIVSDKAARRLSDVETPSGIVAVASRRFDSVAGILARPGTVLVLADLSDPGNAGTLLRSAEAFGAAGAVFGAAGVDPYHPKVVRAAMGSLFRLPVAIADPACLAEEAKTAERAVAGITAEGGRGIEEVPGGAVLVVGQERRGLGAWQAACELSFAIPMRRHTESLNAAVAGSIALFQASLRRPE